MCTSMACKKATAPAPAPAACLVTRCALTSATVAVATGPVVAAGFVAVAAALAVVAVGAALASPGRALVQEGGADPVPFGMLGHGEDRQVRMRPLVEVVDQRDEVRAAGRAAFEFGDEAFSTIEGNTNDGGSSNGFTVLKRSRGYKDKDFIRLD